MKDLRKTALRISRRFPFSPFQPPVNGKDKTDNVPACESHLDKEFMERLERGEDLDTSKMPL